MPRCAEVPRERRRRSRGSHSLRGNTCYEGFRRRRASLDGDSDLAFFGCDRYLTIAGPDCDDADASTYPNAPEVNDGLDNQCAGEPGHGLIDELSGKLGFFTSASKAYLTWPPQFDATSYEVVRATSPDFASGCTPFVSSDAFIVDEEVPAGGGRFYYLARPLAPHAGSFGIRSDGTPREVCP